MYPGTTIRVDFKSTILGFYVGKKSETFTVNAHPLFRKRARHSEVFAQTSTSGSPVLPFAQSRGANSTNLCRRLLREPAHQPPLAPSPARLCLLCVAAAATSSYPRLLSCWHVALLLCPPACWPPSSARPPAPSPLPWPAFVPPVASSANLPTSPLRLLRLPVCLLRCRCRRRLLRQHPLASVRLPARLLHKIALLPPPRSCSCSRPLDVLARPSPSHVAESPRALPGPGHLVVLPPSPSPPSPSAGDGLPLSLHIPFTAHQPPPPTCPPAS